MSKTRRPGEVARRRGLSRRKLWAFRLISCLLLWLILDTVAYISLLILHQKKHIFYRAQIPVEAQLEAFGRDYFQAELGWDIPTAKRGAAGERAPSRYLPQAPVMLKIFGDSFAFGDDVEANESIGGFIEQTTDWTCLNYGVPAYGPDQALLKYQGNSIHSEYSILTVLDENIGRCVTVWWNFYQAGGPVGTKPRFVVRDDSLELLPNALQRDELQKLKESTYIERLSQQDYWPAYYKRINAPPSLAWPASWTIGTHLDFFSSKFMVALRNKLSPTYESVTSARKFSHLYENDSEGLQVLCRIVDEFMRSARSRNEVPLVVIFPLRDTVDVIQAFNRKPYQSLIDHLAKQQHDFIDFGQLFAEESYDLYYQGYGHFSPRGNSRVADEIVKTLRQMARHGELLN